MSWVLLDLFGTLVEYDPSRTAQDHSATHDLLVGWGYAGTYDDFLTGWVDVSESFDRRSDLDDSEFSMDEVALAFLSTHLRGLDPTPDRRAELVDAYIASWSSAVRPFDDTLASVERLAGHHRLAVVSNTHHAPMVHRLLAEAGIAGRMHAVITSVEVGHRKPHPAIYASAVERLGTTPDHCTFVGDTLAADHTGPTAAGMRAFLLDPTGAAPIPPAARIATLTDLADRLCP